VLVVPVGDVALDVLEEHGDLRAVEAVGAGFEPGLGVLEAGEDRVVEVGDAGDELLDDEGEDRADGGEARDEHEDRGEGLVPAVADEPGGGRLEHRGEEERDRDGDDDDGDVAEEVERDGDHDADDE
ncbi:hypothetical protein ADL26_15475, partial [Thermoactinomyces vulgaris]